LPHCFLCYAPPKTAPDVDVLPATRNGFITFGSMNGRIKIGDECVALWASLLQAVPDSRLLLKSAVGLEEREARDALLARFVAAGVAAERIDVRASAPSTAGHLAIYNEIDIALDTYPYNGTTTTCEALWMGVPVVSLVGDRHVSRVGASLLANAGMPQLAAREPEDFLRIARDLVGDLDGLASLRAGLREQLRHSPLLDRRAMGERLGGAFRAMWQAKCEEMAGHAAQPAVPSEGTEEEPIRLHIGGEQPMEGWKILNVQTGDGVDFVGDIRHLDAWADECCAAIYASHVLEHVALTEVLDVIRNLHRMLVPGGTLYLAVPDLDVLTWLFQNPGYDAAKKFQVMRMMFGGAMDEHDQHLIGLNFDFLVDYLREAGFTSVEHVESFGMLEDGSEVRVDGTLVSLNLVVTK
jgi:predicted SAM-dependent methyltransferase